MRKPFLALAVAATLVAPAVVSTGPASAASFKPCAGSYDPQGNPGGGFYSKIKAKRITCPTAKKVTLAWIKKEAPGTTDPTAKVKVLGYTCKGKAVKLAPGDLEGGLSVLCTNGTKAVSFYGHP